MNTSGFTRQELVKLFSDQFFILDFRSRLRSRACFQSCAAPHGRMVLAMDACLHRNEGSVFHIVCSKTEVGHRNC